MKKLAKNTKKMIVNLVVLAVLIAATLIILFTSNRELNFGNIRQFLSLCRPGWIVGAFACMFLFIAFEGLSLHFICHTVGHKCRLHSSMVYATADVYYSAITPSAAGGQPASAVYMVKDGMSGGAASFALVFNLIAYTAAILVIGAAAFLIRPAMFQDFGFFVKLLVIVGIVTQALLLGFFIACMFCHGAVLRCGNAIISFLHKVRLVKNTEKWRGKLLGAVNKYKNSFAQIRRHRALFFIVLLLNIGQRVSQMLITCFVCRAAAPDCSFAELFAMQAFVTLGYNSIPLPGGVGAFEYLYLNIFCLRFENAFILSAMMVTRAISYYLCMAVSGVATLAYHAFLMRKKPSEAADCANGERSEKEADGATGVDASAVEKAEIASEAVEKVEIVGGEPEESE